MRIVEPSFEIIAPELRHREDGLRLLQVIELAGRTCYKSEGRATPTSAPDFVRRLMARGHLSVIEHAVVTARVICDRAVANELVRHRLASYAQESTRYCNYSRQAFGGEIAVIRPPLRSATALAQWEAACKAAEAAYLALIAAGEPPEMARAVLPLCLKTEVVVTANLREWRHIFQMRVANPAAHPQIRHVLGLGLAQFKAVIPVIFDDLEAVP